MSDHVKTSIRNAVAKALDGLAATGDSVFSGRTTPPPAGSLPCLLVYTGNETSALDGASKVQQRRLQVLIEACLKELDDLELLGETIQKEVETALGAPGLDLGGAKSIDITDVEVERASLEKPAARWRMTFVASYYTARGAPDVAL
jgi:hypothetical protein